MAVKDDWFGNVRGSDTEAKNLLRQDLKRREAAEKSAKSVILNTNDLAGNYDAKRALETTLGGVKRALTNEDIIAFQRNIEGLKANRRVNFQTGITARQIIDMAAVSLPGDKLKDNDITRARKEIKFAVPYAITDNVVRFKTNASPQSKDIAHYVTVQFLALQDAATGTATQDIKKSALWLCRQPLKFNCDCGRHTYWFRYIATIGGFAVGKPYGREEFGYPKIRNPGLVGVACKHVLRVMGEIESSMIVTNFLARAIESAIKSGKAKASVRVSEKEAKEQSKKEHSRTIKTSTEKSDLAAKAKAKREAEKAKKAAEKALKEILPSKKPKRQTASEKRKQEASNNINTLLNGLSDAEKAEVLAQLLSQVKSK